MATRPTPRQVAHAKQAAEDVTENETAAAAPPAEPDSLQSLLAELSGSASGKITVYRTGPNQKQTYVFQCAPEAFSLDDLRDRFNGGDFRLYITRNGVLWKNITVSVEPKQSGAAPEAPPSSADSVLAVMREGFQKQAEVMRELVIRTAAPAPAPMSPFAGVNIPELITALAAFMKTMAPAQAAPVNSDRAIDMLMKGIELAQSLKSEGGGEEPSMLGILRDLIKSPMLATAVAATVAQPQPQARPQPRPLTQPQPGAPAIAHQPPPAPAPSFAGETAPPAAPQETQTNMNPIFKHYLRMLVQKAASGADASLYADLVLDNLPDAALDQLLNAQPSTVDYLISIEPNVAPHREWFQAMIDTIILALTPDDGPQSGIVLTGTANASEPAASDVPGGVASG